MNAGQRMGGVFGAVLVFFGAFLPAISAPVYGGIPLLQTNIGGILVIAAIIGAIAALIGAAALVRIAGIAGVGAIVFFVLNYYTALANAGGTVSQLEAGLGGSFSLGVGIWVVLGGAVTLFLNGKGKR